MSNRVYRDARYGPTFLPPVAADSPRVGSRRLGALSPEIAAIGDEEVEPVERGEPFDRRRVWHCARKWNETGLVVAGARWC